jgi:hypothetical protein
MELGFVVGYQERHQVVWSFNKFWGVARIYVDGVQVLRKIEMFSVKLVKEYQIQVGQNETHVVMVTKERKLFYGGFRPQICRVFVDGVFIMEGTA